MKKDLIISVSIILFIFVGVYFFFYGLKESVSGGFGFGTECKKSKNWIINDYKIQEFECIGFAGPPFYRYNIYMNEELLYEDLSKLNSCILNVEIDISNSLEFNLCNQSVREVKNKTE